MNSYEGINLSGKRSGKFTLLVYVPTTLLVVALFFFFGAYIYFSKDLPDLRDLTGYQPMIINEFYSSDGELIAQYGTEKRVLIDLEKIPDYVVNAFIAVEDKRFYQHGGVDTKSVVRAVVQNLVKGRIVSGGSTITQQITKNLILSPERDFRRKIKEAILSYRIEKNLSKDEILYLYLNHIYLADGVFGVEMASQNYFGKSVEDINIAEAALLAGIPKRPEMFSPRANPENAQGRQKTVIRLMRDQGYITSEQQSEALEYGMRVIPKQGPRGQYVARYFLEHVRDYLEKKVSKKAYEKGGFKVYTTLDTDLSVAAYRALRRGVRNLERRQGRARFAYEKLVTEEQFEEFRGLQKYIVFQNGGIYAAVVTETKNSDPENLSATIEVANREKEIRYVVEADRYFPAPDGKIILAEKLRRGDVIRVLVETEGGRVTEIIPQFYPVSQGALVSMDTNGNVLAMMGGYDFNQSKFNRSSQAKRQPGSAFKPFLYSAALDKGYTQTSKLHDVPIIIDDWIPENSDEEYMGAIFFRESLINSRNLSSIRLIMDIDPEYVADYSRHFGFKSRIRPFPSLALGSSEVSLLELTSAYSVFANGGIYRKPRFVLRIYDRNGRLIEDNTGEMYLQYEKKLKQLSPQDEAEAPTESSGIFDVDKEDEEDNMEETHLQYKKELEQLLPQDEAEAPTGQFGIFGVDEREEFLTAEEFRLLIQKIPFYFFGNTEPFERVISPETAYVMTDIMAGVISQGTGIFANRLNSKAKIAGKTGTTNDYTDAWFIGYSPMVVTGVWIGKDDNTQLGDKESGSRAASPVWTEFMDKVLNKYRERTQFEIPNNIEIVRTSLGNLSYKINPSLRKEEEVIKGLHIKIDSPPQDESEELGDEEEE